MSFTEDFLTDSYDYHLPEELIAERPTAKRDAARLMVIDRSTAQIQKHTNFHELTTFLREGDLLVLNNTKVLAARLYGSRLPSGGGCEVLLLRPMAQGFGSAVIGEAGGSSTEKWEAMTRPAKKLTVGCVIDFGNQCTATVVEELAEGLRVLAFNLPNTMDEFLQARGNMPLPPYILARRGEKESRPEDKQDYQTVYAKQAGSVAAPTAGLHFTDELLQACRQMGVQTVELTLKVGAGTFKPINTDSISDYAIHQETYSISPEAAEQINQARSQGRRIIAVGTTSTRALESAATADGTLRSGEYATSLMITPGYNWKCVDGLITNFHLPRSSLLCLVSALITRKDLLSIYDIAIAERYRFYSYGDAMLIV